MYEITALLAKRETLSRHASAFQSARVVLLAQGIAMIPMTDELFGEIGGSEEMIAERNVLSLPSALEEWVQRISQDSTVAYVEAGYVGGIGGQKAVAWSRGLRVLGPMAAGDAIDQALQLLGVSTEGTESDEFDAVGLGAHRHTERWISQTD